ncbi:MAG: serine aminopeptidase domain-containing protein [Burkholderiaceae bacterium]
MVPLYFGAERKLFGIFHPPASPQAEQAVLICNPFGQEAIRTHRLLRVAAEKLAQAGYAVMRFDYFGTGDSAGQDDQTDLDGWLADICAADEKIRQRSAQTNITWLGVRLGATAAALAAQNTERRPRKLILWEPILSGPEYLQSLRDEHYRSIRVSYSIAPPQAGIPADNEASGFALGAAMREQLTAMAWTPGAIPPDIETVVLAPQAMQNNTNLTRQIKQAQFEHDFDFSSEEALNTALVPHAVVERLCAEVQARS